MKHRNGIPMKKALIKIFLSFALVFFAYNVFAEENTWYVTANGFTADFENGGDEFGYNVAVGKYLNENISVELGYANFGADSGTFDGVSAEFEATAIQLSALGYLSLSEKSGLFGRIGVERISTDGDNTDDTEFFYGVGGYVNVTESVDVRLEIQQHEVLENDVITINAGVAVKTF